MTATTKPRKGPLVPSRDLAGATPETLALALLRPLRAGAVRQAASPPDQTEPNS